VIRAFGGERVFLPDLLIRPAPVAVELGDHRRIVLEPDLIDPVLEAVQLQQSPIADETERLDRVEDHTGAEIGKRGCRGHRGLRRTVPAGLAHPRTAANPGIVGVRMTARLH
jgi:hypothetical protein